VAAASVNGDKRETADATALETTGTNKGGGANDDQGKTMSLFFLPEWTRQTKIDSSSVGGMKGDRQTDEMRQDKNRSISDEFTKDESARSRFCSLGRLKGDRQKVETQHDKNINQ